MRDEKVESGCTFRRTVYFSQQYCVKRREKVLQILNVSVPWSFNVI